MDIEILKQAVMDSRDGITISDNCRDDNPLIFVNPAFERMTCYSLEESININCRYLQGDDREQPELEVVHHAIANGEYCLVVLRNYRKDGTMFWNELSISPIHDEAGAVSNFIGIQKDVTSRVILQQQLNDEIHSLEKTKSHLEQLSIKDGLTGVYNRRFFDSQFEIQYKIACRNSEALTLIMIDVDDFKSFNDIYGHQAGDEALIGVANGLSKSFQRGSDFVARYGGEEFVILSSGMTMDQSSVYVNSLCQRVRDLRIAHSSSRTGYLTISIGFSVHQFTPTNTSNLLLTQADKALYLAKERGRNQCVGF
ncbi:diguanylate cyclase [Pseudomonas sp. N40(2020)]|uniref:diguanylate cyclase n=1 Tax=Pseudomonas sp. N40(2020) TaxID=2767798 RepID=UPI001656B899|nr:diguanylate cyclase [Pseudomonas sp. N40(2020)]MBC8998593.1 diguanylate cyclase [Pseudomonas sp. N40(2020)]